ncbi:MAG TPA: hypothetical protein VJR89_20330, partial [Polyangiales bacterium]|nr:hypothetical protein [Polyangiales bacterium]
RADSANTNAGDRLMKALAAAQARYQATPEAERVYNVEEAIRRLVEFVVCSIGIGARTLDHALLWSLPPILEPFAPLTPIIRAMWANAYSSAESHSRCRVESARNRWLEVLDTLANVTPAQMSHVDAVRNAIIYAVGMNEAQMGMASAIERADRLDDDPYQKLSALALRKIIKLQQGDWQSAERLRREAEIVALQMHSPPMFHSLLLVEQQAYYYARDLSGLQGVIDSMKPLAQRYPGWDPHLRDAQARFELVRGDAAAAKRGFEDCLQRVPLDEEKCSRCFMVWVSVQAGLVETLIELDDFAAARRSAEAALAVCEMHGMQSWTYDLQRALALCEAKHGEVARACERLDALISKQTALGVTGVCMGLSHEARARIAIWAGDGQAFEQYASATAREYRHGAQSPLAARYERLIHEATRQGLHTTVNLADFVTSTIFDDGTTSLYDVHGAVLRAMAGAQHISERANRALRLLCDARGASGGHLYLKGPEGFALFASHVLSAPPEPLHMLAREYLLKQQTRTDMISEIATGDIESEEQDLGTSVRIEGIQYDLMLLSCAVGGVGRVAGVAAIAAGSQPALPLPQGLLLHTLATHLLHADEPA